jgi:hypothetical protein
MLTPIKGLLFGTPLRGTSALEFFLRNNENFSKAPEYSEAPDK